MIKIKYHLDEIMIEIEHENSLVLTLTVYIGMDMA